MKKLSLVLAIVGLSAFISPAPVKLKVELTQNEWQARLNLLEYTKMAIRNSDLPVKEANPLMDSITVFENVIVSQLQTQIKDSTKK